MLTYAILSIGDGLIGQISALLISITAGIIGTCVPGEILHLLAADLTEQISRQPQACDSRARCYLVFRSHTSSPCLRLCSGRMAAEAA
ncbi:hypothetical protein WJ45_20095 [Burkholderia ubonensis]|nr:hypothetical protein WJ45_20095 [Burkholderia ubonensis]KVQ44347.1 hypothetical protein WK04_15600 [Burkholderia ubonensis]